MLLTLAATARAAPAPLVLEARLPLPGVVGRIDHLAYDPGRNRLYVAEYGNGSVDAVDLASGKRIGRIAGLKRPQGVAYAEKPDLVIVASAGDGSVIFYRGADLSAAGLLTYDRDADNIRIDPRNGDALVAHGHGGLALIDPAVSQKLADIALPAHPEGFSIDPGSGRIYVNVPDAGQIAIVDPAAGRQVATWTPNGLHGNFPLAISDDGAVVAVGFREPPALALFEAKTGRLLASLAACRDADDAVFDGKRTRFYVSCGDGTVAAFAPGLAGSQTLGAVATAPGARTALFVPQRDRLYVAAPGAPGTSAAILVFRPLP